MLIADDAAGAEALAPVVLEAASKRWTYRLFPRLLDVLDEWIREDRSRMPVVLEAFGQAAMGLRNETAAGALVDAAEELRRRVSAAPVPRTPREGWFRPRAGEGVPLPWALEGVSARDLAARRIAFVDARLPRATRTAYVTAAFEAFLSTSCGNLLDGSVAEACREVGLVPLRWAALAAAFGGLSGDGTEPGLVDDYIGVDAGLTTRVLDEVSYAFPSAPCDECVLLRSWLRKRPNRWQVRAALEPALAP